MLFYLLSIVYITNYINNKFYSGPSHGGPCCFLNRDNNKQVIICLAQKAI